MEDNDTEETKTIKTKKEGYKETMNAKEREKEVAELEKNVKKERLHAEEGK